MSCERSIHRKRNRRKALEEYRQARRKYQEFIAAETARDSQRPGAIELNLTIPEREKLEAIVRCGRTEQRLAFRSRIILEAGAGRSNKVIADKLGCNVDTVGKWRGRFAELRLAGLDDAPRSGRPVTFTLEQKCAVLAKSLSTPPEGLSCWSLEDLADAVKSDPSIGILSICPETIRTWLRDNELQPHRNKYWLNSKDPEFKEKMNRVLEMYLSPPEDGMLWCLDEKTGIQALFRKAPTKRLKKGLIQRMEFEYKRKGTVGLLAAFDVKTGHVEGQCYTKPAADTPEGRKQKETGVGEETDGKNNSAAFILFLQRLMAAYPEEKHGKLYLILDNGSTHTSKETGEFLAAHPRLVPVYLPIHASWLNQVEIWFAILSRRALRHYDSLSVYGLAQHIMDFMAYYNKFKKHPFQWKKKPLNE